jgi:hypothetical protein
MRAKWVVPLSALVLALTACTSAQPGSPGTTAHTTGPPDLVVLDSPSGVVALDSGNGSVPFRGAAAPAFADWSTAFTTTHQDGTTTLRAVRIGTGQELSHTTIRGELDVRVASDDGSLVALMAPLRAGASPWSPEGRTSTDLVVADSTGAGRPQRYHLPGNLEPEAFSVDDARLFLISYLPAANPTKYRVVGLDLASHDLFRTYGRNKQWVGAMTGTRLMQVPAANGAFLFTLYSDQPPRLAEGYDAAQASADGSVAFVHTLNLEAGQAVCVDLPQSLWGGNPEYEAITVSPTDTRVFVVDTSRGVVAVMRSDALRVVQRATVDFGLPAVGAQTRATVSPDGSRLYVSTGTSVVVLDSYSLVPLAKWNVPQPVSGLGLSPDGRRLFLSLPGAVQVTNPVSGRPMWTIAVGGVDGIQTVLAPAG